MNRNKLRPTMTLGFVLLASPLIVQAKETVRFIHTDALGSVVAVSDETGNIIERREYEPFGAQLTPVLADGPGYTGHVQDAATGLTYMQQRYYDPQIGIFYSVDPVTAYNSPVSQFHRYRYANNNPYRFTDLDGRISRDDAKDRKDWRSITAKSSSAATQMATSARSPSGRPLAGSASELFRNAAGAVIDATNMTLYGEVSGAGGLGGTLSYSDNLRTGEQKLDLVGAIGTGLGAFAGVEIDIVTFGIPGAKNAPVFFDSADMKVGDVIAGGLKLQLNPGGTATLKGFGGIGAGGKGVINKPFSIGTTIWSNKDD